MPSWCENTLKIKGKSEDIYKFCQKHIVGGRFDFNTLIPEPETEDECPVRYNLNKRPDRDVGPSSSGKDWFNWYEWRNSNWGCKWNSTELSGVNLPDLEKDINEYNDTYCEITFLTPWSSPTPILDKILQMDTDLEIEIHLWYEMTGDNVFHGKNDNQKSPVEEDEDEGKLSATDYAMDYISLFKNHEFGLNQNEMDAMAEILNDWKDNFPDDKNLTFALCLDLLVKKEQGLMSYDEIINPLKELVSKAEQQEPADKMVAMLYSLYLEKFFENNL